jgi:putative membrane protein
MKTYRKSMTRLVRAARIGTALGAAIFAVSALAQNPPPTAPPQAPAAGIPTEISHRSKEFLQFATQANQTEIAMANAAEPRSQNSAVKELANMMLADHQQNFAQVRLIAQNHMFAINESLDVMNQRAVSRLQKADEANLDKDYAKDMLRDHVKCITRFDKAAAEIEDPDVVAYIRTTLPTLRNHLRHSEDLARSVGVDEGTISTILKGLPSDEARRNVTLNQN